MTFTSSRAQSFDIAGLHRGSWPRVLTLRLCLWLFGLMCTACAKLPLQPDAGPDADLAAAKQVVVETAAQANELATAIPHAGPPASAEAAVPAMSQPDVADPPSATGFARLRELDGDASARRDLWERLKSRFAMPDLDNEWVRKWENWYSARPDYVERMTQRGSRYLFHIVEEVESRGLPSELALLPFVESAFNPQALSVARASGMWQFMPATGKDFELKQNVFRDDRRDVLASTRAALDYLQALQKSLGDWQLALAAYNWGQGNVQRAMARNARAGLPVTYEQLSMPDETRNYLPKLQAIKNIVLRPQGYGLTLPELHNHPFFLSVPIERDLDVTLAAKLAGLSLEDFQALNPQLNKPVILAAGTPRLLLPYDNANRFVREWAHFRGPAASWTAWVTPRTMKPTEAAKLVGMSEAKLREVNRIPAKMVLKSGSTLLIPRAAHSTQDVAVEVAQNGMLSMAPEVLRKPSKKSTGKGKGGGIGSGKSNAQGTAKRSSKGNEPTTKPASTAKVRVAQESPRGSNPAPR